MESLGDLIKRWPLGVEVHAEAERHLDALLQEPAVRGLLERHPELTRRDLRINLNRIYQYVKEQRHCAACPGLDRCPNDIEGYFTVLECEVQNGRAQLYDRKAACSLLRAREAERQLRSRVRSFYIDESAIGGTFSPTEMVTIEPERSAAVKHLLKYIKTTRENGLQKRGLYLVGPFGTGKTYLMCYMLHELAKSGLSGAIVYVPEFVEDVKSMLDEPARLRETIELMKETDLLVFDDIGAENLSPWVRDHVLGTILNYRMNRKPTFYTSNHDLDALELHFSFTNRDGEEAHKGQRIMDRIRPFVDRLWIGGGNKRGLDVRPAGE